MKIWPAKDTKDGFSETKLKSWMQFHDVIKKFLDLPYYVFRGQRMSDWLLEPSLARILKGQPNLEDVITKHLNTFKLASRGRRGPNPPELITDNDWWSLGQHHGLATPLLDWTSSPYVALFFAFVDPPSDDQSECCAIYALNTTRVIQKYEDVDPLDLNLDDGISFIQPSGNENSRLVAQAGMFSRSPINSDIESWVKDHFNGVESKITLMKILIPYSERIECLKALNIMNINHATLFPDIYGAGKHCTELLRRRKS